MRCEDYELYNNLKNVLVGIDKKDLCQWVGISRQYLYDLINCKSSPSLVVAQRIATYICTHSTIYCEHSSFSMFECIWL